MRSVVGAALLVLTFLSGTDGQQVGHEPEKKAGPKPGISRAGLVQLLQEAVTDVDALKDARSRVEMYAVIATAQSKAGDREAARTAFQQALRSTDAIEDLQSRVYALEHIATGQIESDDRPAALETMRHAAEVVRTMGDERQRNTARSWIVRTVARAGDLEAALRMAGEVPDGQYLAKSRALAGVVEGLRLSGKAAMKKGLPTVLQAAAINEQTFQAQCLREFAVVLADAGEIEEVGKIADILEKGAAEFGPQDVRRGNISHDQLLVLSALAKAQARVRNRDAAVETFQKAVELARAMPAEGEALRSGRLGRLVYERVEAGDIDGALETAGLVVYEYDQAQALMTIARARANAGRRDEANALFRKAIQTAHEIKEHDPVRDRADSYRSNVSECLRTIACAQARAGFVAEAVQTAESIVEPRWKNSAMGLIAMAMARRGEVQPAIELAGKIDDETAREKAMQDIAEARTEAGDVQGAMAWAKSRTAPAARAIALLGILRAIARRPAAND